MYTLILNAALLLSTAHLAFLLYKMENTLAECEKLGNIVLFLEDSIGLRDRARELGMPQCEDIFAWMPEQLAKANQGIADMCPPPAITWMSMTVIRFVNRVRSLL
jgi:hypothetical protein